MQCKYLAFYKPYDVLSTFTDEEGRDVLKNYIPVPGVYSAGRLDRDSEGLLLLTDDGTLIHRLAEPRYHQPKTYLVQVEGQITEQALDRLRQGVILKTGKTLPCRAEAIPDPVLPERSKPITPHAPPSWIRLILQEGKKRQIRHSTAAVGFPTLRLVRVAIGTLQLGSLKPGEWRYLSPDEVKNLYRQTE